MEGVYALKLPESPHFSELGPLQTKWEAAAWRINDSKNYLLEGITRFAAKHSTEFRHALGWTALSPVI